jgi:hypothetical protein
MFSTSGKTALGGLRRAAGKEVELRSTTGQESRSHILPLLKNCAQQYGAFRLAGKHLESRLISAQPERKTEIEKRS